jgi:quercetin dioxygenase-like cupin family protein
MPFFSPTVASIFLLGFAATAAAQPGAVYVNHDKVDAALAKGGALVDVPQARVAGGHRDKPGALVTQKGTSILYVTNGEAMFAAGARTQRLVKGDVLVVPAGTAHEFTSVAPSISYLLITVPVLAKDAKAEVVFADHDKVAATMKKAGPLADIHANEADLFYVIDGGARQVLGGKMVDGRQTAPGQMRGSKIDGGQTYQLGKGDVMWVPAGMPHWFPEIPEPLSYLLVKVFY